MSFETQQSRNGLAAGPDPLHFSPRLPDFIAVGPQRTGTTWLHEVLKGHVGLPQDVKETQYFKWHYDQGRDWYSAHFVSSRNDLPVGEICPVYFNSRIALNRIAADLPHCKIICSLREPVERSYSHYKMLRAFAGLRGFEESLNTLPDLIDCSRYPIHLRVWFDAFGEDNVLVVLYDDLEADPQFYIDRICEFIGAQRFDVSATRAGGQRVYPSPPAPRSRILGIAANKLFFWLKAHRCYSLLNAWNDSPLWNLCFAGGEAYGRMNPATENYLRSLFRPDIDELERLIGRDLSTWKK